MGIEDDKAPTGYTVYWHPGIERYGAKADFEGWYEDEAAAIAACRAHRDAVIMTDLAVWSEDLCGRTLPEIVAALCERDDVFGLLAREILRPALIQDEIRAKNTATWLQMEAIAARDGASSLADRMIASLGKLGLDDEWGDRPAELGITREAKLDPVPGTWDPAAASTTAPRFVVPGPLPPDVVASVDDVAADAFTAVLHTRDHTSPAVLAAQVDAFWHDRPEQLRPPKRSIGAARRYANKAAGSIVHCPGSSPAVKCPLDPEQAVELLRKVQGWHFARRWADIGYHYAVWGSHVWELRDPSCQGAHCPGKNDSHYGVLVLVPANVAADATTLATLDTLLDRLGGEALPHNDFSSKACPGPTITAHLRARAEVSR